MPLSATLVASPSIRRTTRQPVAGAGASCEGGRGLSGYCIPNSLLPNWPPEVRVCGLHSMPYGPPILPADTDPAELRRVQLARLKAVPAHYTVEDVISTERRRSPDEPPRSLPMNAALYMLLPPSLYREPHPYPYTMGDVVDAIE